MNESIAEQIAALKAKDAQLRADYRATVDPLYAEINSMMAQISAPYTDRAAGFEAEAIRDLDRLVRDTAPFKSTVQRAEQLRNLIPKLEKFISDAKPGSEISLPRSLTRIPFAPIAYTDQNKAFLEEQLTQAKKDLAGAEDATSGSLAHWYAIDDIAKAVLGPSRTGGRDPDELAREVIDSVVNQKVQNEDATLKSRINEIETKVIPSYVPALNQAINVIDDQINNLYLSQIPESSRQRMAEQEAIREANRAAAGSAADVANVQPGVAVQPDTSILPGMAANPGRLEPLRFDEIMRQFEETGQIGRPFYDIDDPEAANVPLDELARLFFGDKADQVQLTRQPTAQTTTPVVPKVTADQLAKEIALGSNLGQLTFKGEAVPNQTEFLSNYIQNAGLDAVLEDLSDKGVSFGTGYNAPRVDPDIARELSSKVISAMGFDPKTDRNIGNYAATIQRLGIDEGLKAIAKDNNRDIPVLDADVPDYLDALKKRNEEALGTYQTKQKELFDTNLQNILSGQEVRPTTAAAAVLTPRQAVTQAYEQYGLKPEGAGFNSYVDYFTRFGNDVGLAKLNENLSPVARGQTATLFEPQKPFSTDVYGTGAPSFGGAPSSGSGIGAAFGSQYTPGQFVPGSFQQQINAPAQLPAYESRPLITQAERPSLDAAVQYIESTRPGEGPMPYMTPQQVGATPVQPASYADLFGYTPYTEYIGQSEYTTPMNANLYAAGYEANIPTRGLKAGGSVAQEARGLAAMGRRGDSMLVHMAPEEVAGLRALAMREGTDLTINPETGLPEANRLKRAFKRYGPMIVGALAAPYLGPLATTLGMSTAATAGLLVGGGTMLGGGSFKQGLMKGLGTYGLSSLAGSMGYKGFSGAAAPAGTPGAAPVAAPAPPAPAGPSVGTGAGGVDVASSVAMDPVYTPDVASSVAMDPVYGNATMLKPPPAVPSVSTADAATKPQTFGQKFTEATGFSPSTAIIGGTMLAGLSEGDKERDMYEAQRRRDEEEERRRRALGMESFARANQPIDTRAMYGAGGGLVALARGGMTYMEAGGTTGPTGEPRMVAGNGDGMSDSVPATIEGVQEARLANDEFVIPADVVADIGNGSSSAGAKKLYDMMDRIREARHGTTEQPPEISAEQFMPA